MKIQKTPKASYSLTEATGRAVRYAEMSNLSKRDLLADLEQCTVNADTENQSQAHTAVARAQCLLLALAKQLGISHDGLVTIAAQWAELGIQRLKMAREAQ